MFKSLEERMSKLIVLLSTLAEHMIIPNNILSFIQCSLLIDPIDVQEIGFEKNWITPLVFCLKNDTLPNGRGAARKLKI